MRNLLETKKSFNFTRFSAIKIIAVFFVISAFTISLHNISAQSVSDLEKQKNDVQKKLQEINNQIQKHQQAISQAQKAEASLKNEITIYDNQIASSELQIQAQNTSIDDANLQINELQLQIEKRKKEIEENKKVLGQLIVQLNELQHESGLNIGLGNDNFSSFLDQVQYTQSVQDKVHQIISNIKTVKARLEKQQADLKAEVEKLESLRDQALITQQALEAQRQGKSKLLAQTKGQEAAYRKLLATSQNQEADLQKEIEDLDNSIAAKLGKMTITPNKGDLAMPMKGVLTQGYGNTGFTSLGYSFHNGWDIAAPAGTPIYSAGNGTVVACDTGEAAYGNWCAVKHPLETSTGKRTVVALYAHMRSFKVKAGQALKQGDLIGYEGNTGNTTRLIRGEKYGYHLHLTFFDEKGFGIAKGTYQSVYGPYTVPYGYTYNPSLFLK